MAGKDGGAKGASKKSPKKKPPKPKQERLAGMEPEKKTKLAKAGEAYEAARDVRMDANKVEKGKKGHLIAVMQEAKRKTYEYKGSDGRDRLITLEEGEVNVKVKVAEDDEEED